MVFTLSSLFFAVVLATTAWLFWRGTVRWPAVWCHLPRERVAGEVLGIVCLVWSAHLIAPMFEGDLQRLRHFVWALVPVIALLSYYHLDYLFTRSFGGFCLLFVSHLLHEAFVVRLTVRPGFSVLCYAIALISMFMVASPWRFRDLLQRSAGSVALRRRLGTGLGVAAGLFAVYAFLH